MKVKRIIKTMAILTKQEILEIPICELIECKQLAHEAIKADLYFKSIDKFLNSDFNQSTGE